MTMVDQVQYNFVKICIIFNLGHGRFVSISRKTIKTLQRVNPHHHEQHWTITKPILFTRAIIWFFYPKLVLKSLFYFSCLSSSLLMSSLLNIECVAPCALYWTLWLLWRERTPAPLMFLCLRVFSLHNSQPGIERQLFFCRRRHKVLSEVGAKVCPQPF